MDYSDSDSYESDSRGAAPHAQVSMGYDNSSSYGHSSIMSLGNSQNYHPQHSSEEDNEGEDDDEDGDDSSEDRSVGYPPSQDGDGSSSNEEDMDDEDPPTAVAAPVQPRGKSFRPPVGVGDGSSSSSDEEDNAMTPSSHAAPAPAQVINPNPGPPRGKELRLIMNKEKNKADTRAKSRASNSTAASKVTTTTAKKRKTPPANNDSDSGSDDDDGACVATIVGGSDTEEVTTVATNINSTKKIKSHDGSAVKKTASKKKVAKKGGASNSKSKPKSTATKKSSPTASASVHCRMPVISAEKAAAAYEARTALQETVSTLPFAVADSHTIRSFGRVKPEYNTSLLDARYSSPHAIFPVGFSCDRFEFSPVHGRVIKMRCDILDGSSIREHREERTKKLQTGKSNSDKVNEPLLVDERFSSENGNDWGDGPVFRVTWGEGVEEDKVFEKSCPFDPYLASAHLGGDVEAIAVPLASKKGIKPTGLPEVGMRVSVRFDKCKMYGGTITDVKSVGSNAKNKKAVCNIAIQYDDGVIEIAAFPDPDILLAYQGFPPVETADGYVTEMNGKPVRSVLAKSPIEAWGKTLLSLGLIDEVIYDVALKTLIKSRDIGFVDAKDKVYVPSKKYSNNEKEIDEVTDLNDIDVGSLMSHTVKNGDEKYAPERTDLSQEEVYLRKMLRDTREKLEASKRKSKLASMNLTNARISTISPFAANPFLCRDDSASVESSWMAAAIKREKAKMGNTGNKRKIVTPATIMDKNDTFFTEKIERLVEGLPGSEFAPSYVFHANRSASKSNQTWIQEAKIRHQKRQQKEQKEQEKARKISKHDRTKAKEEEEKVLKRKLQESAADKKRLKSEEEDQKKRERINKRLLLLNNQMDDRLSKEACMMREKSIMNLVRAMGKEFVRRRKAAELIVGNKLDRASSSLTSMNTSSTVLVPFNQMLPPISRSHNFEVVKLWDFLHSFSNIFSLSTSPISPDTLDVLQDALNSLNSNECDKQKRSNAVQLLTDIAIDLCKVISPGLTKTLSSSVQNIEVMGKNGTDGGPQGDADVSCLPVTEWSWREIARMVIINDILIDLGYSKQEAANLLKGYRSGGHPNSKEAKRWKKIEESPVAMMYQTLLDGDISNQYRRRVIRSSLSSPCTPSSVPSDWRFFLHNIKSRSSTSLPYIKDNVAKSLLALRKNFSDDERVQTHITTLGKCLTMLECGENGTLSAPELHKAKQLAISVLESTRDTRATPSLTCCHTYSSSEPSRQKMGFQKMYLMSKEKFKALEQSKEEYMAAALKLKEELEFKAQEGDDDDDDDDDDEMEDLTREAVATTEVLEKEVSSTIESSIRSDSPEDKAERKGAEPDSATKVQEGESVLPSDILKAEVEEESRKSPDQPSELLNHGEAGNIENGLGADNSSTSQIITEEIINTTGHPTVGVKDSHLPTEPAEDFPDGWEVRRIPRLNPTDKRTDRNWYSPKLGLRFRAKADALRFVGLVEAANGDEAAAIMAFHGKNISNRAASKGGSKAANITASMEENKAGSNKAEYDFCEDDPHAPDIIRRCLAVIRSLCATNSAEQFIYPVDPQLYPGYYESVMNPLSLYDVAKFLQEAGHQFSSNQSNPEIEEVVAEVGRKVRTIVQNSICVMSSNSIVNSAEEMLRIFERLFFDWVLAPPKERPNIEDLDDDMCIDHHESDLHSMVLLCDACEGKYNMSRLKPALNHVPSGDWYCPRCISGRNWLTADPRIGRQVQNDSFSGVVQSCKFLFTDIGNISLLYRIKSTNSGRIEFWGVHDVDKSILGDPVEPISYLRALAESPGYGFGRDSSIVGGAIPLAINPLIGDKAAQAALSSCVFKETVSACVSLTHPPEDFTSEEWITILLLLVAKCSQSDELQEISSKLESKVASSLATDMMTFWRARAAKNIVPNVSDDDSISSEETTEPCDAPDDVPSAIDKSVEIPTKIEASLADIVIKSSADEEVTTEVAADMNIILNSSHEAHDEASSSSAVITSNQPSQNLVLTEEDLMRRKRESSIIAKSKRERKREEALIGYFIGNRLKSTAASFEEDSLSAIVKSTLCNQEEGLGFSAVRCREPCHYCGLSDVALGAPLCRTPSEKEWRETFPYALHGRNTYMIAEVHDNDGKVMSDEHNGEELSTTKTQFLTVRVRVGGVLISSRPKCVDSAKNVDSVMQQFLPRNRIGFQSELKFRCQSTLPIISGLLSAHEVCAIAAHRILKDKVLAERRSFYRSNMTREAALTCGKSLPIGTDPFGRSYWVFSADPKSLFVYETNSIPGVASPALKQLHRFHKPEEIASVIVCLGNDPLCESLREVFPEASKLICDRSWSTLLMRRRLRLEPEATDTSPLSDETKTSEGEQTDFGAPFVEDEDVLVESENGKFLWDAVVVDVSKEPETEKVNGYLVHYKNWSSRFDQWVVPDRVVEPNKVNLEVQEEVIQDFSIASDVTPPELESMFAYKFLNAKKRARSTPVSKPELFECTFTGPSASHDEKLLGLLKGSILLIEAALPRGSLEVSGNGLWNPQAVALWRNFVKDAQGPESLMKCILLLENAISPVWLHSQATQLYASIPTQWRAMGEASLSAIALRVAVLDRCLKYQQKKKQL